MDKALTDTRLSGIAELVMESNDLHAGTESEVCGSLGMYPIRVVAKQTGIGVHTLRAWERRYGLPRPSRTAGTHRLYGANDIAMLRRVLNLINDGMPPGRACAFVLDETANFQPRREVDPALMRSPSDDLRGGLYGAFMNLDEEVASRSLSECFSLLGTELALSEVVLPALADIGTAWAQSRASVAAEHFASGLIRSRLLGACEGGSRGTDQPVALLAAGPGDQHEIPVMVLALLLRRRGWRSIFLGSSTPYEAISDATARTRPQLVCLSASMADTAPRVVDALLRLRRIPEHNSMLLAYGGLPFRNNPESRRPLEGAAIYLGDDLSAAADRAGTLLQRTNAPRPTLI
ncbi:MAG: regulatory protein MerR [Chloroflexi bacterium]|nr:regulatory protein MerR [Chloroflexota bacterium]